MDAEGAKVYLRHIEGAGYCSKTRADGTITKLGGEGMKAKQNKKDQPTKKQVGQDKIVLHCETLSFSGESFIKREDLEKLD